MFNDYQIIFCYAGSLPGVHSLKTNACSYQKRLTQGRSYEDVFPEPYSSYGNFCRTGYGEYGVRPFSPARDMRSTEYEGAYERLTKKNNVAGRTVYMALFANFN